MPRLNYHRTTMGDAINALLAIYRSTPEFLKESEEVRKPYWILIQRYAGDVLEYGAESGKSLSQGHQDLMSYYKGGKDPFPAERFSYMAELQPYFEALRELAYKWKLRAPWGVLVLFLHDVFDVFLCAGFPKEVDLPLEEFDSLYPWPAPAPPLELKVPAWAMIVLGRRQVMKEISLRLRQYERSLKAAGLKEYPSSLEKHARWWYEHYVNGAEYPEIEKRYQGEVGRESIKRAVWNFSRLIGVKVKS